MKEAPNYSHILYRIWDASELKALEAAGKLTYRCRACGYSPKSMFKHGNNCRRQLCDFEWIGSAQDVEAGKKSLFQTLEKAERENRIALKLWYETTEQGRWQMGMARQALGLSRPIPLTAG